MKTTDYSRIASRYDDNRIRHTIPRDERIERHYNANEFDLSVLDLACGTGNYLLKQASEYREYAISWTGIDKSPEMLAVAKGKSIPAELIEGDACAVPLRDGSVDYATIRFAFHHFLEKERAVGEIARILRPRGGVTVFNLAPDYMNHSWMYRYFPSALAIDRERFPTSLSVYRWFDECGFDVTLDIRATVAKFAFSEIIEEVENRDMSQLNLISDDAYLEGLERIRSDAAKSETLVGDVAFLDMYAVKR